jgi:hypothetical protein
MSEEEMNERKAAEKAARREQTAIAQREKQAERQALSEATLGTNGRFRFFRDGTATFGSKPRSKVLDAHYFDGRNRKSTSGRSLAALATGGMSLLASNNAGYITVTVATADWTKTYRTKNDGLLGSPAKIHGLAMQAKAIAKSGANPTQDAAVPPPPVADQQWAPDPYGRFRTRYFDGTQWTRWVADGDERIQDSCSHPAPDGYDGSKPMWASDPFGRHQYRLYKAGEWTESVANKGEQETDPPEHAPPMVGEADPPPPMD